MKAKIPLLILLNSYVFGNALTLYNSLDEASMFQVSPPLAWNGLYFYLDFSEKSNSMVTLMGLLILLILTLITFYLNFKYLNEWFFSYKNPERVKE